MHKKCQIFWGGLTTGPIFVNEQNELTDELEHLRSRFIDSQYFTSSSNSVNEDLVILDLDLDMKEYLAESGYDVIYSDYDFTWDILLESTASEQITDLRQKMKTGIVTIRYYSVKDGKDVTRRGTLNNDLGKFPPRTESDLKKKRRVPRSVFCYYDVDKNGWRSFRKVNFKKLIKVEKPKAIEAGNH